MQVAGSKLPNEYIC